MNFYFEGAGILPDPGLLVSRERVLLLPLFSGLFYHGARISDCTPLNGRMSI